MYRYGNKDKIILHYGGFGIWIHELHSWTKKFKEKHLTYICLILGYNKIDKQTLFILIHLLYSFTLFILYSYSFNILIL